VNALGDTETEVHNGDKEPGPGHPSWTRPAQRRAKRHRPL